MFLLTTFICDSLCIFRLKILKQSHASMISFQIPIDNDFRLSPRHSYNTISMCWILLFWHKNPGQRVTVNTTEIPIITELLGILGQPNTYHIVIIHIRLSKQWQDIWTLMLTHWGWVKHICIGNLTIIGSDNGSSPGRRQAIIRANAGILLIGPLGTDFSEILFIHFQSRKCIWKYRLGNGGHFVSASMCSGTWSLKYSEMKFFKEIHVEYCKLINKFQIISKRKFWKICMLCSKHFTYQRPQLPVWY